MNTPKIVFYYSRIYDEQWKEVYDLQFEKEQRENPLAEYKYPIQQQVEGQIEIIKPLWEKDQKNILEELSLVTHLPWVDKQIICYVVGRLRPFSHPLTVSAYLNHPNHFVDMLTHELVHQLLSQDGNWEKAEKATAYLREKYKNETRTTRIHIPVHAIHQHILLKYFNQQRLDTIKKRISHIPDYKRAWEIVEQEGYENITEELFSKVEK